MKRSVVVGTAGHIDHGKSALVRALTGMDPDRLKEEQERGITIDLGFAHLETDRTNIAFVDVPGHERFVKNMLAGAGGIDLVLLVVAADESVMPQTREHFHICKLLEVQAGAIVLTKTDLADHEMLQIAEMDVHDLVKDSFLAGAPVLQVSSKTGQGLERVRSVIDELASRVPGRSADTAARLPIDRVFTVKGFGTVVTGTLVSGTLREEQEVVIVPGERRVKIRGLQIHGRKDSGAEAGRRVAVNLGGIDVAAISRGDTLSEEGALEATRRIDVALDLLPDAKPLKHGARVRFHHGTSELLGRVAIARRAAADEVVSEARAGDSVFARIRLEAATVLTRGDRFIVRAYSPPVTIGGGRVLDPQPPRGGLRTAAGRARLQALSGTTEDAVRTFVSERRGAGLPRAALVSRAGLAPRAAAALAARLVGANEMVLAADLLVSSDVAAEFSNALLQALQTHHQANPLSDGMPREEARERVFGRAAGPVFEHVLERLVDSGRIAARDRLAMQGHSVSLSVEEARVQDQLLQIYRNAKLAPPDVATATATAASSKETVERILKLLLRQRALVKVDTLVFHAQALEDLKHDVRALKASGGVARVDVTAFKEKYGITRKYAIPLLEFLDRERITRRVGDSRIVL